AVRQEDRRPERACWENTEPDRDTRRHDRSFPGSLRGVWRAAEQDGGHGPYRPPGGRSAGATAADRDGTPSIRMPLRELRQANASGFSRRRECAGAIRRADRGVRGLSAALPVAAREASGRTDGRSVRREPGDGNHRQHEPILCRALPGFRRRRARPCGGGAGEASGRNRFPDRRQNAMAAYRIYPKRGSLPEGVTGIAVHDHWKPYYTMKGVLHALCNAHHLRELKALVEIEREDWARKMQRLLRRAWHGTNLAREQGVPLSPRLIALIERCYDAILAQGFAFHASQPA